jgi:hypothetical protein
MVDPRRRRPGPRLGLSGLRLDFLFTCRSAGVRPKCHPTGLDKLTVTGRGRDAKRRHSFQTLTTPPPHPTPPAAMSSVMTAATPAPSVAPHPRHRLVHGARGHGGDGDQQPGGRARPRVSQQYRGTTVSGPRGRRGRCRLACKARAVVGGPVVAGGGGEDLLCSPTSTWCNSRATLGPGRLGEDCGEIWIDSAHTQRVVHFNHV